MERVLIVDECPGFRGLARCVLEDAGFRVIEAHDGLAGLQRAIEDAPDLILLDFGSSRLDGPEVCRCLRNEPQTRRIPIVIWSSSTNPVDRILAIEAGACAYIARTFRPFGLAQRVRESLCPLMPASERSDIRAGRSA